MNTDTVIIPPQGKRKGSIILRVVYDDTETLAERNEKMKVLFKTIMKNPNILL